MISTFTYREESRFACLYLAPSTKLTSPTGWLRDLRHMMGSRQAGTGASLSVVGRPLNPKSTQTSAIYVRLLIEPSRSSMETAATAMLQLAGLATADDAKLESRRLQGKHFERFPPASKSCPI
ncbi:hypothetical protein LMG27174_01656 [Paraburkholderia rhynchosiae]|uniref:Uncharacterized protein n=1 Tax=Paraburkholderia rhynchosiae TaxID=487049 RepID=A0A2N7WQ02_9BURK|nr:hypothetical protein C0Z16_10930 [Paraburkholderia rhynchosiae]CAB3661386.1 hypothetical protein LMG27174_01656 [Paraburkholderia rhynchosiae]